MEYSYEESDKNSIEKHKQNQVKKPTHFQNSYSEMCRISAYDNVIKIIDEGKSIEELKSFLIKINHDMLSD